MNWAFSCWSVCLCVCMYVIILNITCHIAALMSLFYPCCVPLLQLAVHSPPPSDGAMENMREVHLSLLVFLCLVLCLLFFAAPSGLQADGHAALWGADVLTILCQKKNMTVTDLFKLLDSVPSPKTKSFIGSEVGTGEEHWKRNLSPDFQ